MYTDTLSEQYFFLVEILQKHKIMQRTLTPNGLPIAVVGNNLQTATQIRGGQHVITNSTIIDLWNMYAFNTSTDHVTLSVEFGTPHCTMTIVVPPKGQGALHVVNNMPLPRNTSVKAHTNRSNVVYLYGLSESSSTQTAQSTG